MIRLLLFSLLGYLSGSILFANLFARLFHKSDITAPSKDHNPGTANAYLYGGFWCGTCTLCCELLKGFLPVHLFLLGMPLSEPDWKCALVLAAPVIGHAFSLFHRFRGGKGVAATFGCLLGLFPDLLPLLVFAAFFLFFSLVLRISPHFYRTVFAYVGTAPMLFLLKANSAVCIGFLLIALVVCFKLHLSKEVREKLRVKLAWTR